MKARARELRKNATLAEQLLWTALRRQQRGYKFRRQHPIHSYIVDFYCAYAKVAIELDGSSHDGRESEDTHRQRVLESQGIKVLRFRNEEVMSNIERVVAEIVAEVEARGDRQH